MEEILNLETLVSEHKEPDTLEKAEGAVFAVDYTVDSNTYALEVAQVVVDDLIEQLENYKDWINKFQY